MGGQKGRECRINKELYVEIPNMIVETEEEGTSLLSGE